MQNAGREKEECKRETKEDRYLLGHELGRGGLGKVLLAMDRDLMDREVAMKLMLEGEGSRATGVRESPSDSTPPARARFLEEALVTAQMWYPNIIPVLERGTRPTGELYYTMPVVSGRTLKAAIQEAHQSLANEETMQSGWGLKRMGLLQAFQGLCHGIAYAHSRGVIHRDIKPANVMVGEHGETIVVDWGLAKVLGRGGANREDHCFRGLRRTGDPTGNSGR